MRYEKRSARLNIRARRGGVDWLPLSDISRGHGHPRSIVEALQTVASGVLSLPNARKPPGEASALSTSVDGCARLDRKAADATRSPSRIVATPHARRREKPPATSRGPKPKAPIRSVAVIQLGAWHAPSLRSDEVLRQTGCATAPWQGMVLGWSSRWGTSTIAKTRPSPPKFGENAPIMAELAWVWPNNAARSWSRRPR